MAYEREENNMARTVDIDAKIEQQEQKILKLQEQLEEAQNEYDRLVEKKTKRI